MTLSARSIAAFWQNTSIADGAFSSALSCAYGEASSAHHGIIRFRPIHGNVENMLGRERELQDFVSDGRDGLVEACFLWWGHVRVESIERSVWLERRQQTALLDWRRSGRLGAGISGQLFGRSERSKWHRYELYTHAQRGTRKRYVLGVHFCNNDDSLYSSAIANRDRAQISSSIMPAEISTFCPGSKAGRPGEKENTVVVLARARRRVA